MPVKAKPSVLETSDGQEFPTREEADAHQELVEATSNYERAKARLNRATACTLKTADGHLFAFGGWELSMIL